jgi:hypothetical protein
MCSRCDTLAADLTAEVMLAAAERELILAQANVGESVPQAIRPLSDVERRAKMRFSEIEALEHSAAEKAAKLLASNAQVYVIVIISEIFGKEDAVQPSAVVDALDALNRAQPDDVIAETARSQSAMSTILSDVYAESSKIVIGEAQRQGVKKTPKPLTADAGRFDLLAKAVALHPWTRLTSKLQADMMTPATLMKTALAAGDPILRADVQKTLEAIPLDGAEDLARQTIHTAHGAGRVDAAATMPPVDIVASELLDGATCDACARVDGKEYKSLTAATREYETGGYGACKGGARCRGTLVFLYNELGTDAPPVVPEPSPLPVLVKPKTPRKKPTPQPAPVVPDVVKTPPDGPKKKQAPAPAAPGLPAAPTGTPPKRRKGQTQRYDALNQLPVQKTPLPARLSLDYLRALAKDLNPGYADSMGRDKNYSNNCSSVVQAYEMRRRGFDVKAAPVKAGKGRYDEQYVGEWWQNADGTPAKVTFTNDLPAPTATHVDGKKILPNSSMLAKAKLDEYIDAMPDGARGFVALHWTKSGGHVFNFEKIDGKAVYLEGQTGNVDAARHLAPGKFKPASLRVFRTDDKVPTDAITEALETRPDALAAELAAKPLTVTQMKAQSQHRVMTQADGKKKLLLGKYRVNPFTRKWEEIPADVLQQVKNDFLKHYPGGIV